MSVFRRTIGLRGEDTSTEILTYLLAPENPFVPFQKLFFLRACGMARSSADLNAELVTQQAFPEGIPDALILTEDTLLLIENKLGSPLSGDDQLIKYIPILRQDDWIQSAFPTYEPDRIKKRILVFLAPRGAIPASIRATENYSNKNKNMGFDQFLSKNDVLFKRIAWEDLITDLDDSNALQRELVLYVQDYIEQEMTMREKEILMDVTVPSAIEKLFLKLGTIQNSLAAPGFKPGRMGQSYNYFGFRIEHELVSPWFGYSLPYWAAHGTPVILQLRAEWIKTEKDSVISIARECGFDRDDQSEWVLPFSADEIEAWSTRLSDVLERFADALREVKPLEA